MRPHAVRGSLFVQRDARADPPPVDVEIDAHHFALAHSDKIIHESGIAILVRPDKHHPDFGLRFLTIERRHERSVIDFSLQNLFVRIFERRNFLAGRFHFHTMPGE